MSDKRKQSKALKELEETKILVSYLVAHNLDFDDINNFSDNTVKQAKVWHFEQQ